MLLLDQTSDDRGLQEAVREHKVRADQPAGVRHAPRVGVKHRHHRQHDIVRADAECVRQTDCE